MSPEAQAYFEAARGEPESLRAAEERLIRAIAEQNPRRKRLLLDMITADVQLARFEISTAQAQEGMESAIESYCTRLHALEAAVVRLLQPAETTSSVKDPGKPKNIKKQALLVGGVDRRADKWVNKVITAAEDSFGSHILRVEYENLFISHANSAAYSVLLLAIDSRRIRRADLLDLISRAKSHVFTKVVAVLDMDNDKAMLNDLARSHAHYIPAAKGFEPDAFLSFIETYIDDNEWTQLPIAHLLRTEEDSPQKEPWREYATD